jgi:uncharacterized membrane protein
MEELLHVLAHYVALGVEAIAILIIAFGSLQAVVNSIRLALAWNVSNIQMRSVWLQFAHWLVAALTFQLAADIVNTSFAPTWDELGRLGVIAAIRTFLSFFLDREVENTRKLQHAKEAVETSNRG